MAKKEKKHDPEKEAPKDKEMSLEEAKAYRASMHKPQKPKLSEQERKEKFRVFWASAKQKYGQRKNLEEVLWEHLKAAKLDEPEKFEEGLAHFGLKKVR